jgi:hypothetical protein
MNRNGLIFLTTLLGTVLFAEAIKIELLRDAYERLGTNLDFYELDYQNGRDFIFFAFLSSFCA